VAGEERRQESGSESVGEASPRYLEKDPKDFFGHPFNLGIIPFRKIELFRNKIELN
jgi:hypothetical protein